MSTGSGEVGWFGRARGLSLGAVPALIAWACIAQAHAQQGGAPASQSVSQSTSAKDEDALAGPRVRTDAARTLVHKDFNGALTRLERPAEEAALELLTLSDRERTATQAVLTERAAILDGVVGDNIPLLLRLQGAREEGLTPERRDALRQMVRKLAPLRARGSLRDELFACLDTDNATEFDRLIDEYSRAVVEDGASKVGQPGEAKSRGEVAVREQLAALGLEIKRSYDRRVSDGLARLDDALRLVEATPEQEARIRNLTTDFFQQVAGKPSQSQRMGYLRKVMAELEPAQRTTLLKDWYAPSREGEGRGQGSDETMDEGAARGMGAKPAKDAGAKVK